jgi:hypothetical protein
MQRLTLTVIAASLIAGVFGGGTTAPASARAAHAHAGTVTTLRYFTELVTTTYRGASGTVIQRPPTSTAGQQVEITELYFPGTDRHHAAHWSATSHTVCVFKASGAATCDGQVALGGNQMLFLHTPVDAAGGGDTVVRGGTGRYAGASGVARSASAGGANNTDIVIVVHLRA